MTAPLISFDARGWREEGNVDTGVWVWYTPDGDGVGLFEFNIPPDLPLASTLEKFRALSDEQAGAPHVELDFVEVAGRALVRRIVKTPQTPMGMTYIGSLTVPFSDRSFVLKVQCAERGLTGQREAILFDQLVAEGVVRLTDGQVEGDWEPDHPRYDSEFPDHPVSRARRVLALLENSLVLDSTLHAEPVYQLPSPE